MIRGMRPFSTRPVQGDVVRARLDALLAELAPMPPEGAVPEAAVPEAEEPGPGPRRAVRTRESVTVVRRAWEFGRAHAAVVGVVGLVALLGAVWTISQARTVPIAVAAPSPVAPSVAPSEASPSPTPEPLRVHVLGAVASPGVVRLPPGARVEDAIAAAGGLTEEARPGDLNLAAPVADGAQVVIGSARDPGGEVRGAGDGTAGATAGGSGGGGGGDRLDLNRATLAELDALPGVGPVTAQAILTWREQHQRFSRVEELLEIDGIGPKTFQRLEPHVRV